MYARHVALGEHLVSNLIQKVNAHASQKSLL